MTYQEFKQNTIHAIQTKLGPNTKVILQDIVKNNNLHLDGLTILSEQSNISPTIYLNSYYKQYLQGMSLSAIYEDILLHYKCHTPKTSIDISFFTDFEKVQNHIVFKLINYERNKELLSQIPHFRYLDLAIVFNCLIHFGTNNYGTILIHHNHLNFWHVSSDDLYALAMENTPLLFGYTLQNMAHVIENILSDDTSLVLDELSHDLSEVDKLIPMYVLSSKTRFNGAVCLLYQNLLADIASKYDSDLYIIPSSIHEVLLIPSDTSTSHAQLSAMVREVNATQVLKEEILSDHVYYYSRATGKLSM